MRVARKNPPFGPWYSVNLSGYRLVYYKGLFQGKARKDETLAAFYVVDDNDSMLRAAFWSTDDEFQLWVEDGKEPPVWAKNAWVELWGSMTPSSWVTG